MQVADEHINQMLRNLPQDQQNQMAAILRNEVLHEVICEHKKGKTTSKDVIAQIMNDGSVMPMNDTDGIMFLRASRRRTDGEYGFECWCGRDSRIAPNETGILKANGGQPSKEDLVQMANNLQKSPPKYATINGERDVDGFIIKKVGK